MLRELLQLLKGSYCILFSFGRKFHRSNSIITIRLVQTEIFVSNETQRSGLIIRLVKDNSERSSLSRIDTSQKTDSLGRQIEIIYSTGWMGCPSLYQTNSPPSHPPTPLQDLLHSRQRLRQMLEGRFQSWANFSHNRFG